MSDTGQYLNEIADSYDAATVDERAALLTDFLARVLLHGIASGDCAGLKAQALIDEQTALDDKNTAQAANTAAQTTLDNSKQQRLDLIGVRTGGPGTAPYDTLTYWQDALAALPTGGGTPNPTPEESAEFGEITFLIGYYNQFGGANGTGDSPQMVVPTP